MKAQIKMFALALAVGFWINLDDSAMASHTIPLVAEGEGQVLLQYDPTPDKPVGVQYYVIEGTGTLIGNFVAYGTSYFTLDGSVSGELHFTTADGATMTATYEGFFSPIDATTFEFTVAEYYGDGTGRLAGVTGEAKGTALLDATNGQFPALAEGVWLLH